jgi:acyl carrier protein
MSKIYKEIADFIKDRWNVQEEDLEAQPLVDYLDSLDRIELGMELERMYDITIMDEELKDWAWFSDVVRCVYNKVTGK